ncbi:hypothetical protein BDN72DRAFT_856899 [Pluteus cervinus]|uniref:Uncharacterized protein n=1 Tax=Pluteus cervinus TaxID=181527 RepID=A0ACD3AYU7_9AGAR|nr:hypothetical protein BDN72DRAFT_856899 [Pluteus cervinus]
MTSVQLLDLPSELILLIAEKIPDRSTTLALWSTSQLLKELLTQQGFSHLILDFRGEPPRVLSSIEHLRALGDGTALACRYARTLEIWSLRNLYSGTRYTTREGVGEDEDFGDVLEEALSGLECINSLSWLAGWGDLTNVEEGVIRGVRSLVSFHQGFTATIAAFRPSAPVVQQLRDICPTSFILVVEWGMHVLYGGLRYHCRRDTGILAFDLNIRVDGTLRSEFEDPPVTLKDMTYWLPVASFKGIQTLKISGMQTDVSQTVFYQPAFWMALQDAQYQLIEFSVDFITDTMLDYLASFSTLRYLCIRDTQTPTGVHDSEDSASKFYKRVLRAHRDTLQTLAVDITLPGPWFLQHSNMEHLFACRNLQRLAIPLSPPTDAISEDLLVRFYYSFL